MAINSISSLSQSFKAMPSQVNAMKNMNMDKVNINSEIQRSEDFSQIINKALEAVDSANKNAIANSETLLTGQTANLHSVVRLQVLLLIHL